MQARLRCILSILFFMFVTANWASTAITPWFTKGENNQIKLRVDLFLSSTCPHCQKADAFFRDLESKEPWLDVHRYMINQDKAALTSFHQALQKQSSDDYSVPAIFFCDSRWIGFNEANNSGRALLRGLNYCYQQVSKTGSLNSETTNVLKQWANASWFDSSMVGKPRAAVYIPAMAFTDAFGPCAIFTILALFAFLWLSKNKLTQLSLGFLFIVVLGLVHYLQQEHTIFFYQTLLGLRIPAMLVGAGLFAYIFITSYKGFTEHQKFLAPILVALTALVLQAYQQTCTPNFSLIFEQWLINQHYSFLQHSFYEGIYHLIYLLPLVLLMLCFIYFCKYERLSKFKLFITCTSWSILLIIAVFLIFYPQGLASFKLSLAAFIFSLLSGWLMTKRKSNKAHDL